MAFVQNPIFITAVFLHNFQYKHEIGRLRLTNVLACFISEFMDFNEMTYWMSAVTI
jgi:hypothetical protein